MGSIEATERFAPFLPQLSVLLSVLPTHPAYKHDMGPTLGCCNVLVFTLNFTPVF